MSDAQLELQTLVKNHSQLHPRNIAREMVEKYYFPKGLEFIFGKDDEEMETVYYEVEDMLLYEAISGCNRTALLLRTFMANEVDRKLGTDKGVGATSGKEIYFQPFSGFIITGIIPAFLLERVGLLTPTGIVSRWDGILKFLTEPKGLPHSEMPEAAKMDGNILVIFMLLLCGLMVAIVIFICEVGIQIGFKRPSPRNYFRQPQI